VLGRRLPSPRRREILRLIWTGEHKDGAMPDGGALPDVPRRARSRLPSARPDEGPAVNVGRKGRCRYTAPTASLFPWRLKPRVGASNICGTERLWRLKLHAETGRSRGRRNRAAATKRRRKKPMGPVPPREPSLSYGQDAPDLRRAAEGNRFRFFTDSRALGRVGRGRKAPRRFKRGGAVFAWIFRYQ